jgi:tRNA pseudouridine55 synthase
VFGLLNVHKPPGPTSHDVVSAVRRRVGRGVKVGHAGTLDPFAEGVLVICLGRATRLVEYVQALPKRYTATIVLAATSSTDDAQGEIRPTPHAAPPGERTVREALGEFVGDILQSPPAYSAVHADGQRAYKLARSGRQADLPPRKVTIHRIDVLRYRFPELEVDIRCGSGTYVRALARDLGRRLSVGGYCGALVRTAVGPFLASDAVGLDDLDPPRQLLSSLLALPSMPRLTLDEPAARRLALGQAVVLADGAAAGDVAVIDEAENLLAIAVVGPDGRTLRPKKVFLS